MGQFITGGVMWGAHDYCVGGLLLEFIALLYLWYRTAEVAISWVGVGRRIPVALFSADIVQRLWGPLKEPLPS